MLTKQQKYLLAQLVRENKEILLRKFGSPGVTKKRKEQIWESIRQELLDLGAELPNLKTLRDTEWNNLRRATIKRFLEHQKNGTSLTEIDEIIMDSVGRDYVQVKTEESDSTDCDYSKYLTVECDPIVVQPNFEDDQPELQELQERDLTNESTSNEAERCPNTGVTRIRSLKAKSSKSSATNGVSVHASILPILLKGDQIVPPSNARQQQLKRQRLETAANESADQENYQDLNHYSDDLEPSDYLQQEVDYERLHLEKELLREEIHLRRAQILECQARTSYYQAATKSILDKTTGSIHLDPLQ